MSATLTHFSPQDEYVEGDYGIDDVLVNDRSTLALMAVGSVVIAMTQAAIRAAIEHRTEYSIFILSTFALYGLCIVLGLKALRRGRVLWGLFHLCHLIVPVTIFLFQCWMMVPFSNWRAQAISHFEACGAIIGINAYMATLNVITAWEVHNRPIAQSRTAQIYRFSPFGETMILVGGALCIALLLNSVRGSRDEFILDSGVGDRFVLRLAFAAGMFLFALSQRSNSRKLTWLGIALVAVGLFSTIMGFRFFLFTIVLNAVVTRIILVPPSFRTILTLTLLAPLAYLLLIISAYTRQSGMSPMASLGSLITGKESMETVIEYAGGNEQCTFFTFVFVEGKHFYSFGEYYGISVLRMLPNGIYTKLSDSLMLSIGHFIAQQCAPKWFLDNGLTLGGYFYTEAYVNFGAHGPYLSLVIAYWFSLQIERLRDRWLVGELLYTMCACSVFTFVLYGLENYLKPLLLMCIFAIALSLIVMPNTISEVEEEADPSVGDLGEAIG